MAGIKTAQKRVIIASEATYGTDQVDVIFGDGDADIIYQDVQGTPSITPLRDIVEIDRARSSHSGVAHKSLANSADVSITFALTGRAGSGSGSEAPYYAAALKASGHAETVVDSTSATYNPATAQQPGMTVYLYHELEDGKQRLQRATGVRGNMNFVFETNTEARAEFTGKGRYVDVLSDEAQFFSATTGAVALEADGSTSVTARTGGTEQYADNDPIMVRGITATINGNSWCIASMNLNTNWTLHEQQCAKGTASLDAVKLTRGAGQRVGGSFTLQTDDTTVIDDFIDLYETADEFAITIELTADDGGSGDAKISLTASKAQLGAPSMGDNGGFVQFDIPFFLNGDFSDLFQDDDYALAYTAVS
jgi:predicted lipoprotein with Yx(FWY)xxD motif